MTRTARARGAVTDRVSGVLAALAAAPGDVVRRATLIAAAWPDGAIVHDNTLHVYIARLRRKLREIGATAEIDTVRGVGYRLQ